MDVVDLLGRGRAYAGFRGHGRRHPEPPTGRTKL